MKSELEIQLVETINSINALVKRRDNLKARIALLSYKNIVHCDKIKSYSE